MLSNELLAAVGLQQQQRMTTFHVFKVTKLPSLPQFPLFYKGRGQASLETPTYCKELHTVRGLSAPGELKTVQKDARIKCTAPNESMNTSGHIGKNDHRNLSRCHKIDRCKGGEDGKGGNRINNNN